MSEMSEVRGRSVPAPIETRLRSLATLMLTAAHRERPEARMTARHGLHEALHLGPADQGRRLTREAYERASYEQGFEYELVAGRLYVAPKPNPPHDWVETRL